MAFSDEQIQKARVIVEEFFSRMGAENLSFDIASEENVLRIDARVEDPGLFIGQSGQVLFSTQHILRQMLRRLSPDIFYVDLDINDYKKNKIAYLKEQARETADEVALSGIPKELEPMTAYERRIVHMELAQRADIATESLGEREDRRVAVKPR